MWIGIVQDARAGGGLKVEGCWGLVGGAGKKGQEGTNTMFMFVIEGFVRLFVRLMVMA